MATDLRAAVGKATPTAPSPNTVSVSAPLLWTGRAAAAALLGAMGAIHLQLWFTGYADIPVIGPSFLADTAAAVNLAVAVLIVARRRLAVTAAAGALLTAATLAALVLSLTVGLFGFTEVLQAPLVVLTLGVESGGVLVLAAVAVLARDVPARHSDPARRGRHPTLLTRTLGATPAHDASKSEERIPISHQQELLSGLPFYTGPAGRGRAPVRPGRQPDGPGAVQRPVRRVGAGLQHREGALRAGEPT